ncbi:hypothetical protein ACFOMD_09670 [Sphingoaurantiacus capsulatus]|uniref:PEP-CTERM protein-sorting domain-containing protein n=1 Tax=Sphingoaurantiacus capsulatus TaxID=1771310 RepID=A0ABV7XCU2_9SPHN
MRAAICLSVSIIALASASDARAAAFRLDVVGNVDYLTARQGGNVVSTPSGMVSVGDEFRLSVTFDTAPATVSPTFDADPTVNIYDLVGSRITARIGSYTTTFSPLFSFNSQIQIWNDRDVVGAVDAQSFNFFNYNFSPPSGYAFDVGSGLVSESITFNAFDFSASARGDDLITSLMPLSLFASRSFNYGLLNADSDLFLYVGSTVNEATLTAIPAPAGWQMMMLGIGLLAARPRRFRRGSRR